jgi:hypothetical protein
MHPARHGARGQSPCLPAEVPHQSIWQVSVSARRRGLLRRRIRKGHPENFRWAQNKKAIGSITHGPSLERFSRL